LDPLDIMLHLDRIIPYYQPVISADTQLVVGYEVMAYFQEDDGDNVKSLAWFYDDSSIPGDFQLELHKHLQQKVMDTYLETDQSKYLLINYDVTFLLDDNEQALLSFLQTYADKGLDLTKVYIQIKESEITDNNVNELRQLFMYMQTLGVRIAIDDAGQRNGNLHNLILLKPNIVKIDTSFLKDDFLPQLYRDVHYSISMLSRKIGAALLFKGVSSFNQFNYAWRNGGQYYQGSYLKRAHSDFIEDDYCKEQIITDFQYFVNFERKKMKAQLALTNRINEHFQETLSHIKPENRYDDIILSVGEACSEFAFRVFICNEKGEQLSSNANKNPDGEWILHEEGRHKNWSWRPYFFENIVRMNVEKKGILSDLYTDIEKEEQIRTYSYPISESLYIFLDIPYAYLFEQEGLL